MSLVIRNGVPVPIEPPMDEGFLADLERRACRVCGCTEQDCSGCIARTGAPCSWVEWDLCSACADGAVR